MTKKEINEIKSQYTLEDCGILKLCACYVDGEKNKITKMNETFLNLPEEEKHKYFDIFKKTLSGTCGKNLIDMQFSGTAYEGNGTRSFLFKLRDSELKDDAVLDEFYDKVIASYDYPGNYIIFLINQVYDVPSKTTDNIEMEDASDEVYRYILCSICHVKLSKPGLGYDASDNMFHNQEQFHMVDVPDIGFLFPSFNERSEDDEKILYFSKDDGDFQTLFLDSVLDCQIPLPAKDQKETFQSIVEQTLGEECDYKIVKNIHENLNEMIEEGKALMQPVVLDKSHVKELLEKSGVREEKLENFEKHFEESAGENGTLMATNIAETRKFEVKTPDVIVKVNPERTDLVETMVIEGQQCLVIKIDESLQVNGISVNPNTGEIIDRNGDFNGEYK